MVHAACAGRDDCAAAAATLPVARISPTSAAAAVLIGPRLAIASSMGGGRGCPVRPADAGMIGRGAGQRVQAGLRLRERDDLADVLLTGQDRDKTVDAEREPAVRRRTVGERVRKKPNRASASSGVIPSAANTALQRRFVDPDRTRTQLPAVRTRS